MKEILARLIWEYVTFMGIVLCGKDSPDPPDYAGAAQATAAGNADAARIAAMANRIDQYTPYGNIQYSNLGKDHWRSDVTLSPAQQAMLEKNNALSMGLLDTATQGLGSVNDAMFSGLDESKLAQPSIQGQAVQDAIMSRLQPQIEQNNAAGDNRLANQGIMQGSEAWDNFMRTRNQGNNDLYINAALQGINTGNQARAQGIQEQYSTQNRPIDIINALRTGNQVTLPQFSAPGMQQTTAGPDLLGAANMNYNAQLGQSNAQNAGTANLMNGLFGIGGAYLGNRGLWG